jgi:hypothetical protein
MLRAVWRSLLRFALLGAALFAGDRVWSRVSPAPALIRAPSVEAADDELLLREALARGYERDDPVVFRRLVQNLRFAGAPDERDDASLFEEALALRMHESDPVVRRRLVQLVRLGFENQAPNADPGEAELRAYYERHAASYRSPERVRCTQLYFRGAHEREARRLLARLRKERTAPDHALRLGDPFLHGAEQPLSSREELAGRFGDAFAASVFAAPPGAWEGPIASPYGVHLVFVHEREAERAQGFEEVRDPLRYAVIAERRGAALEQGLRGLRERARVVIESPLQ